MGLVVIKDDVIWFSHVSDDPPLLHRLMSLTDGEKIRLELDGIDGDWVRMAAGSDGRPTLGIKPCGVMSDVWKAYYRDRKGQTVRIKAAAAARPPRAQLGEASAVFVRDDAKSLFETATQAERDAAFQALMDMGKLGYKSDGPYGSRDEIYDRDHDRDA
jgi:hypothetical protein